MDEPDARGNGGSAGRGPTSHRAFLDATLPHLDAVWRIARRAGRDQHLAEDLVQETYLRAYAGFAGHHGDSTRSWLVAICLNLVRSDWRRRARRPREEPFGWPGPAGEGAGDPGRLAAARGDGPPPGRGASDQDDVFAAVQANLSKERVTRALDRLPDAQRQAIVLMDLAGQSASEIAALLGCPRGTVLSRAHRGRRRLAQLLIAEEADHGLL